MVTRPMIRSAVAADTPAVTALLRELGYPVERDRIGAALRRLLDDPGAFLVVAVDDEQGIVGLLSLSCRPVLDSRGFSRSDCVTYRWGRLEPRNPALPALQRSQRHELV